MFDSPPRSIFSSHITPCATLNSLIDSILKQFSTCVYIRAVRSLYIVGYRPGAPPPWPYSFQAWLCSLRRSISMWSLTSDHAHCILELVIIKRPCSCHTAADTYIQLQARFARAKASRTGSFGHTHNSVTSSTMVILREVLPTAYAAVGTF